jgi:hypothetical protein
MHARVVDDVKIIEQDVMYTVHHKVHIFTEYPSVYVPSSELGLSHPSLTSECAHPTGTKGGVGRAHSPAGGVLGESQFRRLEKCLALCLLCAVHCTYSHLESMDVEDVDAGEDSAPLQGHDVQPLLLWPQDNLHGLCSALPSQLGAQKLNSRRRRLLVEDFEIVTRGELGRLLPHVLLRS